MPFDRYSTGFLSFRSGCYWNKLCFIAIKTALPLSFRIKNQYHLKLDFRSNWVMALFSELHCVLFTYCSIAGFSIWITLIICQFFRANLGVCKQSFIFSICKVSDSFWRCFQSCCLVILKVWLFLRQWVLFRHPWNLLKACFYCLSGLARWLLYSNCLCSLTLMWLVFALLVMQF